MTHYPWLSIIQFVFESRNGLRKVDLYYAGGRHVCAFQLEDGLAIGTSERSMQEAVECCYYDWWTGHRIWYEALRAEAIARAISLSRKPAAGVSL